MAGLNAVATTIMTGRDCWASPTKWKHLAKHCCNGHSLSQFGQSSMPAAPFAIEAQSSIEGAAARWSRASAGGECVCAIVTPMLLAPPAHTEAIGARTTATATSIEIMVRNWGNAGTSIDNSVSPPLTGQGKLSCAAFWLPRLKCPQLVKVGSLCNRMGFRQVLAHG